MMRLKSVALGIILLTALIGMTFSSPSAGTAFARLLYSGPQSVPGEPAVPAPHSILNDIRVRRAIAYCTDKAALVASVHADLTPAEQQALVSDTFIPKSSWAYSPPSTTYPYNPATGQSLLDATGWTMQPGAEYRTRDGAELVLTLTTTDSSFRVAYLSVFEAQMKSCGIRLIRNYQPSSWWFGEATGLSGRDFELGVVGWIVEPEEPAGGTLFGCDQIPSPANDWSGQNFGGWCNQAASDAVQQASDEQLPQEQRRTHYATLVNYLAEDVPFLPLFARSDSDTLESLHFNLETYAQQVEASPGVEAALPFVDYNGHQGTVTIPGNAADQAITLQYYPLVGSTNAVPVQMQTISAFRLTALVQNVPQDEFTFTEPISVTLGYRDDEIAGIYESSLTLNYWDSASGFLRDVSETCPEGDRYESLDTEQNQLVVRVCHLSEFVMIGTMDITLLYLPTVFYATE